MADLATLERFWGKVDRSGGPGACHEWLGARNAKGYGQFRHAGQMRQAHRWILGALRGEPLRWEAGDKEEACHTCDNPSCCNLAHLYIGNHRQNMQDCVRRGRMASQARTRCPADHEYSAENTYTGRSGRACRTCARDRTARRRREAGIRARGTVVVMHCPRGHAYDEANTYQHGGHRYCRACNRENARARRRGVAA